MSEHLRQLEDELQVLLFDRSEQGMSLTEAGERLLMPVRQAFTAVEAVRNTALSMWSVPQATLRLGLNSPPEYLRVDEVLRRKTTVLPHLNLEMRTRSSAQIIEQVLSEELDLGYVYGSWNDSRLRIVPVKPVRVSVVDPASAGIDTLPRDFDSRRSLPWIWPNRDAIRLFDEPELITDLSLVCTIRSYERAELRALFDLIVNEWTP